MTYYQLNFFLFVILVLFGVGADKETLAEKDLVRKSVTSILPTKFIIVFYLLPSRTLIASVQI